MRNLVYIVFLMLFSVHAQTPLSDTEAITLKTKVKAQAATTKSIVSDFTQYKHLDFLSNDIITSGSLAFKSPDQLKWEYVTPFKYAVIFKNQTIFINDQGKKSHVDIGSNKLFKQLNNLIINSIKGDMFNDQEFDIAYYKNGELNEVHFSPKNEKFKKYIKVFQISFNDNADVEEVKMVEPSDDYTKIVFKNRIVNKILPDALFTP